MNTTDLSTLSNHAINMIAIQQVQDFLSSTYVFRYNENTHRIVYKRISNDEEFHYLSDYEFNSILKDIKMANIDRKSTRLNSSHNNQSRMPSSA